MKHVSRALLLALSLCAPQALCAFGAEAQAGPGVAFPSPGDPCSAYQWFLENNGTFDLGALKKQFPSINYSRGFPQNSPDTVYLPVAPSRQREAVSARDGIDINITPAWELYQASDEPKREVIVAVIDTGADTSHPDLAGSLWVNPGEIPGDGIDNDGNGCIDDINGWNFYMDQPSLCSGNEDSHGTHTAGIIAAGRDNGGAAGIAGGAQVKVMILKALGGPMGIGSPESVVQAIRYAEANGASICNLSLGSSRRYEELDQAIRDSGMLFVVAAGNGDASGHGLNTDEIPVYPASLPYSNVISVASLDCDGSLSPSSNYGLESVDIAAPGSDILSTVPGGSYAFFSGTSMAAPMVTGAAALLYSYRTDLDLAGVRQILLDSAKPLDSLSGKVASGGMVDAAAALSWGQPAKSSGQQ